MENDYQRKWNGRWINSIVQQSNGAYFCPEKKYISTHHERGQFQNPKSKQGFRILDHLSSAVVDKQADGW